MIHAEAVVKIYFTREYGRFKSILGNRDLSQSKIKRIISDIEDGLDMLKYCPIIVDKDMNVIDGQHRLFVAKSLQSNIWYVISETIDLIDIAKVNSNTDKWKPSDFLNCYLSQGNDHYRKLNEFLIKHNVSLSTALPLLMKGSIGAHGASKEVRIAFEKGEFKMKFENSASDLLLTAFKFKDFSGYKSRYFLDAIDNLLKAKKCNIPDLLKRFEKFPDPLNRCNSSKDFMIALEEIYNYKQHERKIIF